MSENLLQISSPQFEYIIINTSYTSRIVRHYLNLGAFINVITNDQTNYNLSLDIIREQTCILTSDEHKCNGGCNINKTWKVGYDRTYPNEFMKDDYKGIFGENSGSFMPLAIIDSVNGDGIYHFGHRDTDIILKILAEMKINEGIVFKCNNIKKAFKIIQCMQNLDYCDNLNLGNLYEMNIVEKIDDGKTIEAMIIKFND
jgi:hypothetical protein